MFWYWCWQIYFEMCWYWERPFVNIVIYININIIVKQWQDWENIDIAKILYFLKEFGILNTTFVLHAPLPPKQTSQQLSPSTDPSFHQSGYKLLPIDAWLPKKMHFLHDCRWLQRADAHFHTITILLLFTCSHFHIITLLHYYTIPPRHHYTFPLSHYHTYTLFTRLNFAYFHTIPLSHSA